jgi:hypothetical protein
MSRYGQVLLVFCVVALIGCKREHSSGSGRLSRFVNPQPLPDKLRYKVDAPMIRVERTHAGLEFSLYAAGKTSANSPVEIVQLLKFLTQGTVQESIEIDLPVDATASDVATLVDGILKPAEIRQVIYEGKLYDIR